jgi:FkbM family methyltransferase
VKDVGEFDKRNIEFDSVFNRDIIIKNSVTSKTPIVFDIGAHHGQSIDYLKTIFPGCKIYSFEPDPESFKVLSRKESDRVEVFNIAISNQVGEVRFFKNKISHTNSLYKINLDSNDSIRATKERSLEKSAYSDEINREIRVKSTTLSKFIDDHGISHIDLIKIDVQGAEDKVLEGANLSIISSIIVEVSFYDFYEKSTSFMDIEKILTPAGFYLFSILDISRNPMNGRTDWVEVLYKRMS